MHSPLKVLISALTAILSAWGFTDPVLDWMELDPENYKAPSAAVLTLSGEGLMRSVMTINLEGSSDIGKTSGDDQICIFGWAVVCRNDDGPDGYFVVIASTDGEDGTR